MTTLRTSAKAQRSGADVDEALDAAARGTAPTSDDADEFAEQAEESDREETDVTGDAAGLREPDQGALADDPIERRDAHRWELDPASAEDAGTREP